MIVNDFKAIAQRSVPEGDWTWFGEMVDAVERAGARLGALYHRPPAKTRPGQTPVHAVRGAPWRCHLDTSGPLWAIADGPTPAAAIHTAWTLLHKRGFKTAPPQAPNLTLSDDDFVL